MKEILEMVATELIEVPGMNKDIMECAISEALNLIAKK